jgi:hypothetical protein
MMTQEVVARCSTVLYLGIICRRGSFKQESKLFLKNTARILSYRLVATGKAVPEAGHRGAHCLALVLGRHGFDKQFSSG